MRTKYILKKTAFKDTVCIAKFQTLSKIGKGGKSELTYRYTYQTIPDKLTYIEAKHFSIASFMKCNLQN